MPDPWPSKDAMIYGFTTPDDSITWTLRAASDADYAVSLVLSADNACVRGCEIELRCGESAVTASPLESSWPGQPTYRRQDLPGLLHLKAGNNRVVLRLRKVSAAQSQAALDAAANRTTPGRKVPTGKSLFAGPEFAVWSIELGTPAARRAVVETARSLRGDASWMIEGKYGLFVHWSPLAYGYEGNRPRSEWHEKAVDLFDVEVFADAVERTGAAWMCFTMTHGKVYWPGPNDAIDRILPGRTTRRDLFGEIAGELAHRGIRTLCYFHAGAHGNEDPPWAKAAGVEDGDPKRLHANIEAIYRDTSLRYGTRIGGFAYVDDAMFITYQTDPPWERWARAIKAGNPKAVVGFSACRGPSPTPFTEVAVTDGGHTLSRPDPALLGPGRQYGDVAPAWWCSLDTWIVRGPMDGTIGRGPRYPAGDYPKYFREMAAEHVPVTINLAITADVTKDHPIFNPQCVAVMDEVRKAIRGK
jgi:hypothetical protein